MLSPIRAARPATRRHLLFVFLGLCGSALPFHGQAAAAQLLAESTSAGTVEGIVVDADGSPIAAAKVQVSNSLGTVVAQAQTDTHGVFSIAGVPAGSYTVTAAKAGKVNSAEVQVSAGVSTNSKLALGGQELQAVVVTAQRLERARNSLSPSTGSSQYVFSRQAIATLPEGDHTSFNQLLLQAPGVANDSLGQLHIRGDHADIQYRFNGLILPEGIAGFGSTLDTRFADKVTLLTGALPAQYGYRTAGVVDIVTRQKLDGGVLDLYGGSHSTYNPSLQYGASTDRFNGFITGQYLSSNLGIESPTPGANPLHDSTRQGKGFGYGSYLLGDGLKLSALLGATGSRFEIPDNPGQQPDNAAYLDALGLGAIDSSRFDARQYERNLYGIVALQGVGGGELAWQVAAFDRQSTVQYQPDAIGDLVFNGVAAAIKRKSSTLGLQGDLSMPLGESHTLRGGVFASTEDDRSDNTSTVFLIDPNTGNPQQDSGGAYLPPQIIVDNNPKNGNTLVGLYLQDQWDLTQHLVLNYGLRYDRLNAYVSSQQLSPRVGLIDYLTPATVIHAGYARYFTPPANELIATNSLQKFVGTSNEQSLTNSPVKPERAHYFDAGITHQLLPSLNLGLDAYYKYARDLLDEGQFGSALIYTPFNYGQGHIYGLELTSAFHQGNWSTYLNLARSTAQATNVVSGEFNFDPGQLDYISKHYIYLDHDQRFTVSGGLSYLWRGTTLASDFTWGDGLRNDGDGSIPNGGKQPANMQVNVSATRTVHLGAFGPLDLRLAGLNILDRSNQIHDGSGVGVGTSQYGPRAAVYFGIAKPFTI